MLDALGVEDVAVFNEPLDVRIDVIGRLALRLAGVKLLHGRKLLGVGVLADKLGQGLLVVHLEVHRVVDSSHGILARLGRAHHRPACELWPRMEIPSSPTAFAHCCGHCATFVPFALRHVPRAICEPGAYRSFSASLRKSSGTEREMPTDVEP